MAQRLAVLLLLASVIALALADKPSAEALKYKEHKDYAPDHKKDEYKKHEEPKHHKHDDYTADYKHAYYEKPYPPHDYEKPYPPHDYEKPYPPHGYEKPYPPTYGYESHDYGDDHEHSYDWADSNYHQQYIKVGPVQRIFRTASCPATTGVGINSCVVDAQCASGLVPLSCSCRLNQRTDNAYWVLGAQFVIGDSQNVGGFDRCSCWWTSLRAGGLAAAYTAEIIANCVESSNVVQPFRTRE